ncbi:MAG: amidohydrolase [Planctomycetes bacterium]|nr:amidohydrolase [Planctomycetota bacterium]
MIVGDRGFAQSATGKIQATAKADMILRNGRIVTVDEAIGEVQAIAIRGDRILAVGSNAQMDALANHSTMIVDLKGKLAIPGFIEGHGHFTSLGDAKMNLDLMAVRNWGEVIEMVAAAVAKASPGEWIVGRGWHQEKWDEAPRGAVEGFPTHHGVSSVSPNNPVFLSHASGHASFANKKAMDLAGISAATADPPGGEILRDEQGQPIGVFRERASGLISRAQSVSGTRENATDLTRRAIELATKECLSKGVTSFQDAGSSFSVINTFAEMADSGELGVRLWVMIREPNARIRANIDRYKALQRVGNNYLTVGGIKRSIDGALGSRGAWLLEPYADSAQSTGLATATIEDVTETAQIAIQHGLQLCVHAIGDRANREVLNIFEKTFAANPQRKDLRWRIEHAQHLHADDIPRFGQLGVIASMQGIHCTSDAPWVLARLGYERAGEGAYVWQKLMQSGAIVTNGTDTPVEDVSPIASYYATVSRRLDDGSVFFADQRMNRMEALRSYTIHAAYAAFEDDLKGTLTPGKLADIVVLSQDILSIAEDEIPHTNVQMTIVGGKIAYRRE